MKKNAFLLAAGLVALADVGLVQAQSCASPSLIPVVGAVQTVMGNTCAPPMGTGANQLGTLCGAFPSLENDIIYSFGIDGSRTATTFTLTTTTATWNPGMVLLSGACGGGVACADVADNNGAGMSETLLVPLNPAPNAPPATNGLYYLVVTSSSGSGGCGDFTLSADGILPVALQKFSVE